MQISFSISVNSIDELNSSEQNSYVNAVKTELQKLYPSAEIDASVEKYSGGDELSVNGIDFDEVYENLNTLKEEVFNNYDLWEISAGE